MKGKTILLIATLVVASFVVGCAGNGVYVNHGRTNVNLDGPDYKIVATNVHGHSSAGYLFGLSISWGAFTESLALVRVSGTGKHYQEALEDFWRRFENEHGPVKGRSLGLINVRYDADVLNTFFYTETQIFITADVVEFI